MRKALVVAGCLAATVAGCSRERGPQGPSPPFTISASINLPEDDGSAPGTVFQVRRRDKKLLGGAGFQLANNSTQTSNPRVLSVFFAGRGRRPKVTPLGKPFRDGVAAHLVNVGGTLIAIPYNTLGIVPRAWDPGSRTWRDMNVPLNESLVGLLGMQPVRGVPLTLYIYGSGTRHTAPIVYYGPDRLAMPAELEGLNGTDFYYLRGRLYLFLHDHLGANPQLAACRWSPGDAAIADCRRFPVPVGSFFYSMIPDPGTDRLLLFHRLGMVFGLHPDGVEVLAEPAGDRTSEQVYSSMRFEDDLLVGQYPSGSLARWTPGAAGLPYTFIAPKVRGQRCSTQNLREAQSLAIFGGRVAVGVWPFCEIWEGVPGERWRLLARPFTAPVCDDAPYIDKVLQAGGGEKNILGQRIWGMANWSTGLAFSTAAKHEGAAEYLRLLTPEERDAYGRVWLLERELELACEIPGSGPMTLDVTVGLVEMSVSQRLRDDPPKTLCTAPVGSALASLDRSDVTFGQGPWGPFPGSITGVVRQEDVK